MIRMALYKLLGHGADAFEIEVEMEIAQGSLVALYGPSGAGKTSLLRMLAGLLRPDRGEIVVEKKHWFAGTKKSHWSPQQRKVGFVFQDYALFPHWNVRDNLRFALQKGEDPKIIDDLLHTMDLEEFVRQKPGTLSGGQQQRVALARALVARPKILLLDEPLSALDQEMRWELQGYLQRIHQSYGLTSILVSHDPAEVRRLADRVIELKKGRIVADGKPAEILGNPAVVLEASVMAIAEDRLRIGIGENQFWVAALAGKTYEVGAKVKVVWGEKGLSLLPI